MQIDPNDTGVERMKKGPDIKQQETGKTSFEQSSGGEVGQEHSVLWTLYRVHMSWLRMAYEHLFTASHWLKMKYT